MRGLGGEQALRVPVYIAEPLFQMGGRRAVQLAQDFVVRGLGQGDVEVDVGFDTGLQCPGSCGRSPLREVLFEDCGVVCRSPFGGFFGDRDFQYFPHFVQVVQVGAPRRRSIGSSGGVRRSTNVPAPCRTFRNPMLDRILTASRTVERPTPKICINSGSGGSFSPTSNFPDMNCPCNPAGQLFGQRFLAELHVRTGFHHII